nr:hypothetical protein [Tanacetum cinerariifolium]
MPEAFCAFSGGKIREITYLQVDCYAAICFFVPRLRHYVTRRKRFIHWLEYEAVEHLLSALEWTGVNNCHIEIVSSDHNDTSAMNIDDKGLPF